MYKGDERRTKKNNNGWIIGIIISVCLAISGWLFAGLQSANAQTHSQIIDRVETNEADIKDLKIISAQLLTKMDMLIEEMKVFIRNK